MNTHHKYKWLTYKGGRVQIDRDIAPLLSNMWKLGIGTSNSCQAQCSFVCKHKHKIEKTSDGQEFWDIVDTKNCYNNVWLAFESTKDVERFNNYVAEYATGRDTMYACMSCDMFVNTDGGKLRPKDSWAYSFLLRNQGVQRHFGRPMIGKKRSTQEMWVEDGCKKNNFVMKPQITFPRIHLPYVEARIQSALDKKK